MKYNKIIPIIPIVTTCVVTPFTMSSCNPKYVEPIHMHNLLEEYVPTSQQHEPDELNQTQATEDYIKAVNADPAVFYDDVCMAVQKLKDLEVNDEQEWTLTQFMYGVTKPTFGSTIVSRYGSNDVIYSTLTGRQKLNIQYESVANGDLVTTWNIELEVWYKDVVFYAYEKENDEGNADIQWNLGLFDYSIGQEAFWPFVSNMNPWSISFSCESVQSTYYVVQGQPRVLVDKKASYYSSMLDNGSKLINLVQYYEEHKDPPATHVMEWFLEHTAISVILIDYQSRYFEEVTNAPEIRLTHVLQNEYSVNAKQQDISTSGLMIILPTTIEDQSKVSITVKNGHNIVYSVSEHESPMYQTNSITIFDGSAINLDLAQPITDYRYNLLINSRLLNQWVLPTSYELPMDLYLVCDDASFDVEITYDQGGGLEPKTWLQTIILPYSYCVHRIVV